MRHTLIFLLIISSLFLLNSCTRELFYEKDGNYNITAKNADWILNFPVNNFKLQNLMRNDDGTTFYFFSNDSNKLMLSFCIEPAYEVSDTKSYRDACWDKEKKNYIDIKNVIKTNYSDYSSLEYFLPVVTELKLYQQNMHVYLIKDGYWIDVRVAKNRYQEKDKYLFTNFYKSISFIPNNEGKEKITFEDSLKDATNYFMAKGNDSFHKKDYTEALLYYQKAFDNQLIKQTLEKNLAHILVYNLGMSYIIANNLDKAKETFEYGLTVYSKDPMCYYLLAWYYAKIDNTDECIKYLKSAFKYKKNVILGGTLPNPKEDSPFQRYLNNEKFKNLLKANGL